MGIKVSDRYPRHDVRRAVRRACWSGRTARNGAKSKARGPVLPPRLPVFNVKDGPAGGLRGEKRPLEPRLLFQVTFRGTSRNSDSRELFEFAITIKVWFRAMVVSHLLFSHRSNPQPTTSELR